MILGPMVSDLGKIGGGHWQEALFAMASCWTRDVISYNAIISACEKGHRWAGAMHFGAISDVLVGETLFTGKTTTIVPANFCWFLYSCKVKHTAMDAARKRPLPLQLATPQNHGPLEIGWSWDLKKLRSKCVGQTGKHQLIHPLVQLPIWYPSSTKNHMFLGELPMLILVD